MTILRAPGWLAGLAVAAIALAAFRYEHDLQYRMLHTGDHLTPLHLISVNGTPYTLRSTGHPMIINVFATWCTPCRAETPEFAAAASRLRARGVQLVGIDQQEEGDRVRAFARDFGLHYPVYVDSVGITHSVLGARMIPTTIYVDASGVIRWEHAGPITSSTLFALTAPQVSG